MAKLVPNKKEELSVKIAVDTSELDSTVEKIERIRNALEEINGLMSDIFTLKTAPTESEQNYESLKQALFESALSCENEKEEARKEYRRCFDLDGSKSVSDDFLKDRRNALYLRIAQSDILLDFISCNGLNEDYKRYKSLQIKRGEINAKTNYQLG